MTRDILICELKRFAESATENIILPVRTQKGDEPQEPRAAQVYKMRLPDSTSATKKAPYIIVQYVAGSDSQPGGGKMRSSAQIRFIFCVYDADESEGAMRLLGLMERLRQALLKQCVIAQRLALDTESGLESTIYTEDTAPYYIGEMISQWFIPPIEREVTVL